MDSKDISFIEARLGIGLPSVLTNFLRPFPNDTRHRLQNDLDYLPCNAELFVIKQFQRFHNDREFDYYELQPDLRQRRFIDLGDDGCGNFFCAPGDDVHTNELWMWEHDPYNGFSRCAGQRLTDYLGDGWQLAPQPDPFASLEGRFILRADHPVRSILDPISMPQWRTFIELHANLELDENYVATNPFTRQEVVMRRWPGRAKLTIGDAACFISYSHGKLAIPGDQPPAAQSELASIAAKLNAHLWPLIDNAMTTRDTP